MEEDSLQFVIPKEITDILCEEALSKIGQVYEPYKIYCMYIDRVGELTFKNGNIYKGRLLEGTMHGKGELVFADGACYSGTFFRNHIHGEGTFIYSNGNEYRGEFYLGKRHGKGVMELPSIGITYEGEFNNGDMTGFAKITYKDGTLYEGYVVKGKRNGKGKIDYIDGDEYEGDFHGNLKQGYGTMLWKNDEAEVIESVTQHLISTSILVIGKMIRCMEMESSCG